MGIRDLSESAGVDPESALAALNAGLVAQAASNSATYLPITTAALAYRPLWASSVWRPRPGTYWSFPYGRTTSAGIAGQLHACAVTMEAAGTLSKIGAEITTIAAGTTVRLGIYADSNGIPGARLLDAGTIDGNTLGPQEIAISLAVTAGQRLWLAAVRQGGTPTVRIYTSTDRAEVASLASATSSVVGGTGYRVDSVNGALPDPFGVPVASSSPILVAIGAS